MIGFIFRRLLQSIPLLFAASFLTFFLINQSPGNYLSKLKLNPQISQETIDAMEKYYGLDKPWIVSYGVWLRRIVWGDNSMWTPWWKEGGCLNFGYSFSLKRPVFEVLGERAWNTFLISLCAMIFSWVISIPLGIVAGAKQYSWLDKTASSIAFVGVSIPSVFLALVALYFAKKTGTFPTGGLEDARNWDSFTAWQKFLDKAHHLVLPTIVLGSAMTATYMRQMRGNLLDVLGADFVRTARAKGLSEWAVLMKHALRNAINPLITMFGYSISDLLSGAFLVEVVMSLPGLGRTTVEAFFQKDLFLVNASVLMATFMLVVGNLAADILLAWSDPRIAFKSGEV
ncbi:ABC transporter permease [Candidatus Sumerlaeota bacterium]|nr:ABC transporter permease [Candidatus Sumerlaeota bacterium]